MQTSILNWASVIFNFDHTIDHEQHEKSTDSTGHDPLKELGDLLTSSQLNLVE